MCKSKNILGKLLAVSALAGGAILLISKLKKEKKDTYSEDCFCDDDCSECDESDCCDNASRNYVPLSHGQEEAVSEEKEEASVAEESEPAEECCCDDSDCCCECDDAEETEADSTVSEEKADE